MNDWEQSRLCLKTSLPKQWQPGVHCLHPARLVLHSFSRCLVFRPFAHALSLSLPGGKWRMYEGQGHTVRLDGKKNKLWDDAENHVRRKVHKNKHTKWHTYEYTYTHAHKHTLKHVHTHAHTFSLSPKTEMQMWKTATFCRGTLSD